MGDYEHFQSNNPSRVYEARQSSTSFTAITMMMRCATSLLIIVCQGTLASFGNILIQYSHEEICNEIRNDRSSIDLP